MTGQSSVKGIDHHLVTDAGLLTGVVGPMRKTNEFPTDITPSAVDYGTLSVPLHNEGGTSIRIVDIPPLTSSPVHRTVSLDYGTLVSGELWLELDDGSERILKPGDVVVQRGTSHAWRNKTYEWARMTFVLVAAFAPVVNRKKLENESH